jgi:putative DNA primase/helicase
MREQIGDECIYLRIQELKNGNIQFTDSTNAARLIKEHVKPGRNGINRGRDSRCF